MGAAYIMGYFLHCSLLLFHYHHLPSLRTLVPFFIPSNRFVFNMVKGHHLQLRCCLSLLQNYIWFNIQAYVAPHPVIQQEADDLLAKDTTEPFTDGAGSSLTFLGYLCITSGLHLILYLKNFNCYTHIPTFKISNVSRYVNSFNSDFFLLT